MKFKTCLLILTLIVFSCKTEPEVIDGAFQITVTLENVKNELPVYLKTQENGLLITIDSTVTKNGAFEFKGNIDIPTIYGIFIDSVKGGIYPLVERGTINISAHRDSLYAAVISGSKLNDELNNFREDTKKIASKINDLFPEVQKARAENNLKKLDELNKKMQAVNDENTQFSLNYAKNNSDSYVSAMVLQSLLRMPTISKDTIESIYNNFSDKVKQSDYAKNTLSFLENTIKADSIQN